MKEGDLFTHYSIRRSELYEGLRGNRNLFDTVDDTTVTLRNPLWMKQKEVEEPPLELEFWQDPAKHQAQRDDDEVVGDRAYDPDFGNVPKLERDESLSGPEPEGGDLSGHGHGDGGEVEMSNLPASPSNQSLSFPPNRLDLSTSMGLNRIPSSNGHSDPHTP